MEQEELIRDFLKFAREFKDVELMQEYEYEDHEGYWQAYTNAVRDDWLTQIITAYMNYVAHDRRIEYAR